MTFHTSKYSIARSLFWTLFFIVACGYGGQFLKLKDLSTLTFIPLYGGIFLWFVILLFNFSIATRSIKFDGDNITVRSSRGTKELKLSDFSGADFRTNSIFLKPSNGKPFSIFRVGFSKADWKTVNDKLQRQPDPGVGNVSRKFGPPLAEGSGPTSPTQANPLAGTLMLRSSMATLILASLFTAIVLLALLYGAQYYASDWNVSGLTMRPLVLSGSIATCTILLMLVQSTRSVTFDGNRIIVRNMFSTRKLEVDDFRAAQFASRRISLKSKNGWKCYIDRTGFSGKDWKTINDRLQQTADPGSTFGNLTPRRP